MAFVPLQPTPLQFQDGNGDALIGAVLAFFLSGTSTPTNLFSDNTGTSVGNNITLNSSGYPESGANVITLFRDSSIAIKLILFPNAAAHASLTGAIWTADTLEDGLVLLASTSNAKGASLVGVEDSGSVFTATDVEGVLDEIDTNFAKLARANTFTADQTWSGAQIRMGDNLLRRPRIVDYSLEHNAISSSGGTLTIDLEIGNSYRTLLTENTTIAITNPPATTNYGELIIEIVQDGTGGAFTVTWPASVTWPSGSAPVITVTNNAVDIVTLNTRDGGTTWRGGFSQAFA